MQWCPLILGILQATQKTASLSNENEAVWHIEICFAPHKYSTFIYKYQIIVNIIVYMLGRELIEQPS